MIRVGLGFDIHRLVKGRKLILAGIELPFELGLEGHSDADVILHAIMDACLGALALGDIGQHFPNTDEAYRNADSKELTRHVVQLVHQHGFQLGNLDVMVLAEAPKIGPFVGQMRQEIAKLFGAEVGQISLKATTMEKLGPIGRREGIAAEAMVLLESK